MKKSVESQLIDFLKDNPTVFASGDLQRKEWRNKNGTLATPRSLVRRLEENTFTKDNPNGELEVSYVNGAAHYKIREEHKRKPKLVIDESKPPVKDLAGIWRPVFKFA